MSYSFDTRSAPMVALGREPVRGGDGPGFTVRGARHVQRRGHVATAGRLRMWQLQPQQPSRGFSRGETAGATSLAGARGDAAAGRPQGLRLGQLLSVVAGVGLLGTAPSG